MLEIFVGFTMFRVSRPLTIAGGAEGWVPCLVRPVPSPVRKNTTDSARRISSVFLRAGMGRSVAEVKQAKPSDGLHNFSVFITLRHAPVIDLEGGDKFVRPIRRGSGRGLRKSKSGGEHAFAPSFAEKYSTLFLAVYNRVGSGPKPTGIVYGTVFL